MASNFPSDAASGDCHKFCCMLSQVPRSRPRNSRTAFPRIKHPIGWIPIEVPAGHNSTIQCAGAVFVAQLDSHLFVVDWESSALKVIGLTLTSYPGAFDGGQLLVVLAGGLLELKACDFSNVNASDGASWHLSVFWLWLKTDLSLAASQADMCKADDLAPVIFYFGSVDGAESVLTDCRGKMSSCYFFLGSDGTFTDLSWIRYASTQRNRCAFSVFGGAVLSFDTCLFMGCTVRTRAARSPSSKAGSASQGGAHSSHVGVCSADDMSPCTASFSNCTFERYQATLTGGAVYLRSGSRIVLGHFTRIGFCQANGPYPHVEEMTCWTARYQTAWQRFATGAAYSC
ncbi:MAG: hypothetical protein SGPRY_005574 [Prymnesium sp.]